MPVTDGVFTPRSPLTAAELHVDFPAHNAHLLDARRTVEAACLPQATRIPFALLTFLPAPPTQTVADRLASSLTLGLQRSATFGFRQAQAEIARSRAGRPALAAWEIPDAGQYGDLARHGLDAILAFVARRADRAATAVTEAVLNTVIPLAADRTRALLEGRDKARRILHNQVLELVGETINLGRTAGAMQMPTPPTYALRSEQLDGNTCAPCFAIHGTIVRVGSPEYFAILPPIGCLGGGRCRALMVFGDGARDVRQPEPLAA
jgi:hypothetical protein